MKLTIEMTNEKAVKFYFLVSNVKAKGRKSRAVTKFSKLLQAKITEYQEERKVLIGQYYEQEENGNAKVDPESQEPILLENADEAKFKEEHNELDNDKVVVDLTEYKPFIEFLISALNEWDFELIGQDAYFYDELLDLLEELEGEANG